MPNTSRPTWSASVIASSNSLRCRAGSTARPAASTVAAMKLSTPICIAVKGTLSRKIHLGPRRELGRLPACYCVRERNSVGPIRTQIGVSLEVAEHCGDLRSSREEIGKDVGRDLHEGEVVTLSIKHVDDLIEAHEITDEGQILAMSGLIRVPEGSSDDVAEFANVTHVNATHTRIERERPAHRSVCLLLRSHGACEVLVEERRDGERMIRKPRFRDHAIDLRLASKGGNVEFAAADRFDIRQCGPDCVFDAGIPGSLHRGGSLLALVGSF